MSQRTSIADLADGLEARWMLRRDMEAVLRIEREAFVHPWSESDFIKVLRRRNCIGMAVARDGEVVGYMIYELLPTRIVLRQNSLLICPSLQYNTPRPTAAADSPHSPCVRPL